MPQGNSQEVFVTRDPGHGYMAQHSVSATTDLDFEAGT